MCVCVYCWEGCLFVAVTSECYLSGLCAEREEAHQKEAELDSIIAVLM